MLSLIQLKIVTGPLNIPKPGMFAVTGKSPSGTGGGEPHESGTPLVLGLGGSPWSGPSPGFGKSGPGIPGPVVVIPPPAPPAPPPPPSKARSASPRGQAGWARRIQSNYPRRAEREGIEGNVGVTITVGTDGRVASCRVSSSSGSSYR